MTVSLSTGCASSSAAGYAPADRPGRVRIRYRLVTAADAAGGYAGRRSATPARCPEAIMSSRCLALVCLLLPTAAPAQPAADLHGDPLPAGAVARLGSTRWRHGGPATAVAFVDAKTLITSGSDGSLRVWEVPSGRQVRE